MHLEQKSIILEAQRSWPVPRALAESGISESFEERLQHSSKHGETWEQGPLVFPNQLSGGVVFVLFGFIL